MIYFPKVRTQFQRYVAPPLHSLPSIVLIGRVNVGKSMIFNRLTRTREALVADFPGLTRDRLYGLGRIGDRPYLVVDTGGLGVVDRNLNILMKEQLRQAIEEAEQILMVVDAQSGLHHDDPLIAKRLRLSHKPVTLIVNKSEGLENSIAACEFFKLGLGNPYPISALHGQGLDTLMTQVLGKISELPVTTVQEHQAGIRVAIVGRPNAGKSTLINRVLGYERSLVSDQPGTTRDSIPVSVQYRGNYYTLIDTAGVRRQAKIKVDIEKFSVIKSLQAIHVSQVVLLLIDAQVGITDQDLHLVRFILETGRALVIAVNKWDGLLPEIRLQIQKSLKQRLRFVTFVKVCFISALQGTGVGDLFAPIQEAYASAMQALSTHHLTRLLQKAIEAHAPPSIQGRAIKLRYAHPGGHNPPIILIHGKQTRYVPASYKRYLESFYRHALLSVGTPLKVQFKEGIKPSTNKS